MLNATKIARVVALVTRTPKVFITPGTRLNNPPPALDLIFSSTWVSFIWPKNTLILECNFACVMCNGTKIAQVVARTPRSSNHLRAPKTDLNNHHQKAKVRTSADKSTNVVSSKTL